MGDYFELPTEEELELAHHGILGMRWGVRRYQNPDGSLTPAGVARYGTKENYRSIQKARAEAEAYKIRTKAQLKTQKKVNKELLKQKKKLAKIEDKDRNEQIRDQKKNNKLQEKSNRDNRKLYREANKFDRNQQNNNYNDNRSGYDRAKNESKNFAKSLLRDAVQPALVGAGNKALSKYLDKTVENLFSTDADRALKKVYKDLEETRAGNDLLTAKINQAYLTDSWRNRGQYSQERSRNWAYDTKPIAGGKGGNSSSPYSDESIRDETFKKYYNQHSNKEDWRKKR